MAQYQLVIGGKTKRSKFDPRTVDIDFDALPEPSRDFVIRYGLKQYLADGTAGAANATDFNAGVDERLGNLSSGEFKRTRGEPSAKPDSEEGRALKLAKAAIRSAAKAGNMTLTKDQVDEGAKALIESDPTFRAEAKKQLAAEAKLSAGNETADSAMAAVLAKIGVK